MKGWTGKGIVRALKNRVGIRILAKRCKTNDVNICQLACILGCRVRMDCGWTADGTAICGSELKSQVFCRISAARGLLWSPGDFWQFLHPMLPRIGGLVSWVYSYTFFFQWFGQQTTHFSHRSIIFCIRFEFCISENLPFAGLQHLFRTLWFCQNVGRDAEIRCSFLALALLCYVVPLFQKRSNRLCNHFMFLLLVLRGLKALWPHCALLV